MLTGQSVPLLYIAFIATRSVGAITPNNSTNTISDIQTLLLGIFTLPLSRIVIIALCRGNVRMPQYAADTLNGNTLAQSQGREPMASAMEGNILRYSTLFYHLFQWFTDVPIVKIREHEFVLLKPLVTLDYLQWNI